MSADYPTTTSAAALVAALAEMVAEPLAEYQRAADAIQSGEPLDPEADELDLDQCDEIRDEAAHHVLEVVAAVLEAARAAGILPALAAEPVPYWPAEVTA